MKKFGNVQQPTIEETDEKERNNYFNFFFLLALIVSIDSIFTNLFLVRLELAPVAACWGIFISIFAGFKYEWGKKRDNSNVP